ncbi:MAG: hypothetical protein RLN88_03215 [Ekhidna sp.]|uniref:hypothetical protein n=1 Tax=Ekhidna sp. TaxID=2608089 RepID=UPI0032EE68FF
MKVLLEIQDNKVDFVMELLENLKFVKARPLDSGKVEMLGGIQQSVEELNQIKAGKLKGIPIQELLDEL